MESVLLVMPFFNSYDLKIKNEIERLGFNVTLVRDSSAFVKYSHLKFFSQAGYTLYMNHLWPFLFKYRTKGKFDYLFVIKGQELTPGLCGYLHDEKKIKKKVLYLWDSVAHNPKSVNILGYFNNCYTFDDLDSQNTKYKFELIPLFFTNEFEPKDSRPQPDILYDFVCIGSFKEERAEFLQKIEKKFSGLDYKYFFKLYMPWNQLIRKIVTAPRFYYRYRKYIFIRKMSLTSVADITLRSRVVVDVPDTIQSGLTMRTFEALGAGKKLLTTNARVKDYSFYKADNIATSLDEVDKAFVHGHFSPLDDSARQDLRSIHEWVNLLISKLTS